ncbi:hypothetical protein Sjap_014528 [Stephania japonica]|uniref:Uncharacterized protein n=1 Tax=Stephania japonica TaxID=461633 RepID=A0AAP0IHG0_9MAGN
MAMEMRYGSVVFVLLSRIQRTCTVLGDHGGEDISLWEALSIVAVVGGQPAKASALHQIGRIRAVGVGSGSIKASGGVESSSIKASGGFEVRFSRALDKHIDNSVIVSFFAGRFSLALDTQLIEGSGDARVMDCKTHWHKGKLKKALVNPHA